VSNLRIAQNWAGGGACTVNLQDAPLNGIAGVSVTDNRFAKNSTYNCAIIAYSGVTFTDSGNTWTDGTGPIREVLNA